MKGSDVPSERASSGIRGLDEVLNGGFLRERAYLVRGAPGVGKTLLGLHFLDQGVREGESVLFITLGTPEAELRADAEPFGFRLDGFSFLDLSPTGEFFSEKQIYDIFDAPEVEREEFVDAILTAVDEAEPDRVVVDTMTELESLTPSREQFRDQVRSFLIYLKERGCTVLFTSESGPDHSDTDLQYISDGNVHLKFGPEYHQLEVTKLRGSRFERGPHFVAFTDEGLDVFSVILPRDLETDFEPRQLPFGVPELDEMLYGGLERGTSTIISGPTGVGKTTVCGEFLRPAAEDGIRSVVYLFEETERTFLHRMESIGVPMRSFVEDGTVMLRRIEPHEYAPEQFSRIVRNAIERDDAEIVVIDGIEGYLTSIEGDARSLVRRLHALISFMRNRGVTPLLTAEVHTITGEFRATEHKASYLADNILFLTYYEYEGGLHRAISVLKKRATKCDNGLYDFTIGPGGVEVGERLTELRGVLWGAPGLLEEMPPGDD